MSTEETKEPGQTKIDPPITKQTIEQKTLNYLTTNNTKFGFGGLPLDSKHLDLITNNIQNLITTDLQEIYCARCLLKIEDPKDMMGGSFNGICCTAHRICSKCWWYNGKDVQYGARKFESANTQEYGWMKSDINKFRPKMLEEKGPTCTYYCGWEKNDRDIQTKQLQKLAREAIKLAREAIVVVDVDVDAIDLTTEYEEYKPFTMEYPIMIPQIKTIVDSKSGKSDDDLIDNIYNEIDKFNFTLSHILKQKTMFNVRIFDIEEKPLNKCKVGFTFNPSAVNMLLTTDGKKEMEIKKILELQGSFDSCCKLTSNEKQNLGEYENIYQTIIGIMSTMIYKVHPRRSRRIRNATLKKTQKTLLRL